MNLNMREGYLLLQNASKKWKTRWCILNESQLVCHHKKNKSLITNSIRLQGCSIVCPCLNVQDLNCQGLLKLDLPDGEELYFQAGGVEDRDRWAHVLGAVLRSLSTSQEVYNEKMVFQDCRSHTDFSEIIGAIQEPDAGVMSANHLRGGIVFKNCFTGRNIVDWLLRWSLVRNRTNGAAVGQTLLKLGHIQEVDLQDGTSCVRPKFGDSDKLYRFTSVNLGAKRNSFYDSTDSDSSSSEDEDEEEREEPKMKMGKPRREAFLAKKRHISKSWRVVKVIARENPPSIQYYRARFASGADEKFPTKLVSLSAGKVMEIVKPPSTSKGGSASSHQQGPRFRVVIRTKKGKIFTFRMKDEQEKVEWLGILNDICIKSASSEEGGGKKGKASSKLS